MADTRIDVQIAEGVVWITLDGPRTRNALSPRASRELAEVCEAVDADHAVGAAVITGAGRGFCSGADTEALARLREDGGQRDHDGLDVLYAGFRRFAALSVPTLALVNGAAVGAGLNLALAADLRLVAHEAKLVSGFAAIGIHPGGGHLHLLARAAGSRQAAAMGVFARPVAGTRAVDLGLAWAAMPAAELRPAAHEMLAHLGQDPALARALKADLRATVLDDAAWERAIAFERAAQSWSLTRRTYPELKEI